MRGLKQDRSARIVIADHALVQNLQRGHYALGIDAPPSLRLEAAFAKLASTIYDPEEEARHAGSARPQTTQQRPGNRCGTGGGSRSRSLGTAFVASRIGKRREQCLDQSPLFIGQVQRTRVFPSIHFIIAGPDPPQRGVRSTQSAN
jgi:hypothetical protein